MAQYDSFIFAGHGTSEKTGAYDPGATYGNTQEHIIAEKIALKAIEFLKGVGLNIHYDEQNYIDNDLVGNTYRLKFGFSIHINAGKGRGAECYVPLGESYTVVEQNILNGLANIGLTNRGVKSREYNSEATFQRTNGVKMGGTDYYKEIREAWKLGISLTIVEVGFIDSADLTIIQNNIDAIAFSIANAIAKEDNKTLSNVAPEPTPTNDTFYRVICGSFANRDGAEKRKAELEKAGFNGVFLQVYKK